MYKQQQQQQKRNKAKPGAATYTIYRQFSHRVICIRIA